MNAKHLVMHFERMNDAPDAVPRLRQFVLELAVRGRLVRQDPRDGSAVDVLNAAHVERERLSITMPSLGPVDGAIPFTLPSNWKWVRLGELALAVTSGSRDWAKHYAQAGAIFVRMGNLSRGSYRLRMDHVQHVNPPKGGEGTRTRLEAGDILVSITGEVGLLGLIPPDFGEAYINQHTCMVRPATVVRHRFLLEVLRSPFAQTQLNGPQRGIKNSARLGDVLELLIPLPPLSEQRRIVAKLDELMQLCDELQAAQKEREEGRNRLAAASLTRLSQPADDVSEFREHARFHLRNLPRLVTKPEHVKQLRQTILTLAVRGKLLRDLDDQFKPMALGDLAVLQNGYAFKSEWFAREGVRLLRNANVGHGDLRWEDEVRLPQARALEFDRFRLQAGDIVLSLDRPFIATGTKVARIDTKDLPCLLLQRVGRFQIQNNALSAGYLFLWLCSPHFSQQIDPGRSNGVPHVSSKEVESAEIFVPPMPLQARIVAKVDELTAICDQLDAQLAAKEAGSQRLLEAVLHEALAEAA